MFRMFTCIILSLSIMSSGLVPAAQAAVVGTSEALALDDRQSQRAYVERQLARDDVQRLMIALGVEPLQAQSRVASLSDAELAQLASELDSLPAGGSVLALIGAVFVVLLILELVGVTNIFNSP